MSHKSQITNHTPGFGLLEVVISLGILATVTSAVLIVARMAVKGSIIANQRAQAYNLVREDLEAIRAVRDSTWIDEKVNNWNESFVEVLNSGDYYLTYNKNQTKWILTKGTEEINLDGTKFARKVSFSAPAGNINEKLKDLAGIDNTKGSALLVSQVIVSWQSYGKTYSVAGSIQLTDWKLQI